MRAPMTLADIKRVGVLGDGSIGLYLAAKMAAAYRPKIEVDVLGRNEERKYWLINHGVQVLGMEVMQQVVNAYLAQEYIQQQHVPDVLFLCLQTTDLAPIATQLGVLLRSGVKVLVTVQNGFPFWLNRYRSVPAEFRFFRSIDPNGALYEAVPEETDAVCCVVWGGYSIASMGLVQHTAGSRFGVGYVTAETLPAATLVSELLNGAGLFAPCLPALPELMAKCNRQAPLSVAGTAWDMTMEDVVVYQPSRFLIRSAMTESMGFAAHIGHPLPISIEEALAEAQSLGKHYASTTAARRAGRRLENLPAMWLDLAAPEETIQMPAMMILSGMLESMQPRPPA